MFFASGFSVRVCFFGPGFKVKVFLSLTQGSGPGQVSLAGPFTPTWVTPTTLRESTQDDPCDHF